MAPLGVSLSIFLMYFSSLSLSVASHFSLLFSSSYCTSSYTPTCMYNDVLFVMSYSSSTTLLYHSFIPIFVLSFFYFARHHLFNCTIRRTILTTFTLCNYKCKIFSLFFTPSFSFLFFRCTFCVFFIFINFDSFDFLIKQKETPD